jgi:hypothetical protein
VRCPALTPAFTTVKVSAVNRRPQAILELAVEKERSMPRLAGKVAFITGGQ